LHYLGGFQKSPGIYGKNNYRQTSEMAKLKFDELKNRWVVTKSPDSVLTDKIQAHQIWLEMFQAGDFFYLTVTNEANNSSFCSEGVQTVLGYSAEKVDFELLLDLIHPDDLPVMEEFEAEANQFYSSLPSEERWNYKTQYNLRIKSKTGRYKHLMFQALPYRMTAEQKLEHLYIFTDISSIKTNSDQHLSMIHLRGGPSKKIYRNKKKVEKLPDFSPKELEVLEATIKEGDLSVTARNLNITLESLRNHLKRMRNKSGAKSTVHLIAMAREKNWLRQ
jgi:DNA-binding CsgD family transcriptional regulator